MLAFVCYVHTIRLVSRFRPLLSSFPDAADNNPERKTMNTTPQYLYYDENNQQWLPATMADLAALNLPELAVCPLNPDGTTGPQTTYADISKKQVAKNRWNKPAASLTEHTPGNHSKATTPSPDTEYNINYTCNFIRASLGILIFLLFASAGTTLANPRKPEIGILVGLGIGFVAVFILTLISKPSTKK